MTLIEAYIRKAAIARGIDPDIAVRVARAEGGLDDPTKQSLVTKGGRREPSYGPFQLLIGGGGSGFPEGLGNRAVAAGIDPRDQNQWQRGVDFALDEAKRRGWGQWYGAKAAGIGNHAGISGGGGTDTLLGGDSARPSLSASDYPPSSIGGIGSPNQPGQNQLLGGAGADYIRDGAGNSPPGLADWALGDDSGKQSLGNRLANAGQALQADMPAPPRLMGGGDARGTGNMLMQQLSSSGDITNWLLRRRLGGVGA